VTEGNSGIGSQRAGGAGDEEAARTRREDSALISQLHDIPYDIPVIMTRYV